MKSLLAIVLAATLAAPAFSADNHAAADVAKAKAEKVCIKTKDAKTGKDVEKCKVMKKHEKHEGTKVEGTKPDKK
jgi:Ni/Co efflux regulator RcnB